MHGAHLMVGEREGGVRRDGGVGRVDGWGGEGEG